MPHLTPQDKAFFKQNGYLIRHDLLTRAQIASAQGALWQSMPTATIQRHGSAPGWVRPYPPAIRRSAPP